MDLLAIVLGPVLLVVGIAAGSFIGYWYRKQVAAKTTSSAEAKAEAVIQEGKSKVQSMLLEAKDKAIKVL